MGIISRALLIMLLPGLVSCGVYSFTGASIPPGAKTFSVQYFPNNASIINPRLSQSFTDMLKDKFINQTSLSLVTRNGDLQFEGEITAYTVAPVAIQGNDQAALNRLTITVNVRYVNLITPAAGFETSFSRFEDYSSSQSLAGIEDALIESIGKALVEDIFNRSVANW